MENLRVMIITDAYTAFAASVLKAERTKLRAEARKLARLMRKHGWPNARLERHQKGRYPVIATQKGARLW